MVPKDRIQNSAWLSVTAVFSLAVVLLASFALAPQAAPGDGAEPPLERMPRGMGGSWSESVAHLAVDAGPSKPGLAQAPASLATGSKLVFQSLRDGNWEIYRANGDGSNQSRVTHNSDSDIQPRLNRGCDRIAFAAYRGSNYDIYAMNADGTGESLLTWAADHDVNPAWSRDGTRIAFESYRSGQGEVHVMNADGSDQTRLTFEPAWDGEPAWSPDGSAIAFTSYRNSVYRIWRMNADGSAQVQLSNQPYSGHAAWSLDGSLIAYDADGDGDGFQELWLMNADGTDQHQVYDPPEADTDAWVGSWSPDGQYLAFTRISWIYYSGHWYWTTAYLDAWEMSTGLIHRLSGDGEDWYPDWQADDFWPPSSSVVPLPTVSPGPVPVSWSGTDVGSAGIASYDVQVREEPSGTWTDWLVGTVLTTASFPGVGGQTYAFRSRARDYIGNLEAWPAGPDASTTVEDLPPQTTVSPLEPYVRGTVTVAWGGSDAGGSGIATFDVQVRDGPSGAWTDWVTGTVQMSASCPGLAGHTYFFRSRGVDRAQNAEAWPGGDGDASTTLYLWAMTGTLRDNREMPVRGGVVTLSPEALAVVPSDADGTYTAYEATASSVYTATWARAGYGALPPTAFDGATDAQANMTLPPADNAVLNWGFETGSLGPEWLAGGESLPGLTADSLHTGRLAAVLGPIKNIFEPLRNLSDSAADSVFPAIGIDDSGAVNVAWLERTALPDGDVLYTRREPGGGWSEPVSISGSHLSGTYGLGPRLAVHSDGTVHVAWVGDRLDHKVLHTCRSPTGTWSAPFEASQGSVVEGALGMAVSVDGAVHLVWHGGSEVKYARRAPEGGWSAFDNVSDSAGYSGYPQMAVGPDATVHVVWTEELSGNHEILYARRGHAGIWSTPTNVSNSSESSWGAVLAAAADGSIHVTWAETVDPDTDLVMYGHRSAAGVWSDPELVTQAYLLSGPQMEVAPDGSVHLAWIVGGHKVWYAHRGADGFWHSPEEIGLCDRDPGLYVDSSGTLHFLRPGGDGPDILYAWRSAGGIWSDWLNVSDSPADYAWNPRLVFDRHDGVYVVWEDGPYGQHEILYVEPARAEQTIDSILSQELDVPLAAANPTLSFWYRLGGIIMPDGAWLAAEVEDGGSSTTVFTAAPSRDWAHAWVDLSPWADQVVSLRFLVHQTEGQPAAWANLDEVSVGPAYPDLWVIKSGLSAALPGQPVAFLVTYGNGGGAPAGGVVLTDTLPAGLQFVSADPAPSTVTPCLTWQVADLPASSGPFEITLVASVEPSVPIGTTLANVVEIGSSSPELETLNNESVGSLWVGCRVLLPAAFRDWR